MSTGITVLVLTLNEEDNLPGCIASASFADRIVVLDSGSTDATRELAISLGAHVYEHPLDNWSAHLNRALDNLPLENPWVLLLDADERVSPELAEALAGAAADPGRFAAFSIERRDWFMGRPITRVQATPRLVRFFRPERVRFSRLVNPVTGTGGPIGRLTGRIEHYPFSRGLSQWVSRHLEYARLEAEELKLDRLRGEKLSISGAIFSRELSSRRRRQKRLFMRLPLRPLIKFLWLYLARGGFMDRGPGLAYAVLQSFYEYWISLEAAALEP